MGVILERTTFAAGEVSKELRARNDLARQQQAVAAAENFIVLPEGGLTRRPGTRFLAPQKIETRPPAFIPFRKGGTDAALLAVNGGAIRFLVDRELVLDAGNPYELPAPWADADLQNLRWAQSGNVLFVACRGYQPRVIRRVSASSWTSSLYLPAGGPVGPQNLVEGQQIRTTSDSANPATLIANFDVFASDHVGTTWRLGDGNLAFVDQWQPNENVGAGYRRRYNGNVYISLNAGDTGTNPPTHLSGSVSSGEGKVAWFLHDYGYHYVRITAVTTARVATAIRLGPPLTLIPNSIQAGSGTYRWSPPVWSAALGWPDNVRFTGNRLLWTRGDEFWLTRVGDFFDFDETDDDASAVAGRILPEDGVQTAIRWSTGAGTVALLGTDAGELSVRGESIDRPITAATVVVVPETSEGAAEHVPAIVDAGAVFVGKSRRRLHLCRFNREQQRALIEELTLTARHILAGRAASVVYQRDPHRLLWIACEDGSLVAVTLLGEQGVLGWTRHPMPGAAVEAIASLPAPDGESDDLYLAVRRTIGGQTRRTIEVLQPFPEPGASTDAAGAWYVDGGVSATGSGITSVSGLDHLEGETVRVFADGAQRAEAVVAGGAVTIDAADDALVGLPLRAYAKSLPFEIEARGGGSTKARRKTAGRVIVDLVDTAGADIAVNGGTPEALIETGTILYGAALPLFTGAKAVRPEAPTDDELTLELIADNALPVTLAGWSPDIDVTEG